MLIYAPELNLFKAFCDLGIKVENGVAYQQTAAFMNNNYVRLRVPAPEDLPELLRRLSTL